MKLVPTLIITVGLTSALCAMAADPAQNTQPKPASLSPSEVGDLQTSPASAVAAAQAQAAPAASEPLPAQGNSNDGLRLTFRNAPLNLVLDYLSDAAGFIINKETEVKGTVDIYSKHPVTKAEAVDLLNSALNKNGYALVKDGRILNVISLENAKTADTGVAVVSSPDDIQKSDEVVTRIIPVRHANATQLMQNLQVLLPTTATLSVNESANSLIMVATKTQIRRMLEIVHALDTSMASIATIKVFPLNYADAKQLATIIQQIYAPDTSSQNQGGPRGRMFAMFARRFGGQGGQQANNQANAAGSRVVAAADDYSNSLIVSAPADLMATISDMVEQIDKPMSDVTEIRVFHLKNADPTELADQLSQLFPDQSQSNNGNMRGGRFRFMPPFMRFMANQNNQSTTSRSQEKNNVVAVADPRTSSLIVTASTQMMPQIADMIAEIDSSAAKKEMVSAYELQYADPQDVYQVLQDLFNKNNTMRANNNTRGSMLGQNNPLTQRMTSQQYNNNTSRNSGFGSTSRGGGLGF